MAEGADKSGVSSSPSGACICAIPSAGTSGGHAFAPLVRRCR